jgi:hypothetical protein
MRKPTSGFAFNSSGVALCTQVALLLLLLSLICWNHAQLPYKRMHKNAKILYLQKGTQVSTHGI